MASKKKASKKRKGLGGPQANQELGKFPQPPEFRFARVPKKKSLLPEACDGQAEAGVSINPLDLIEIPGEDHPKFVPSPGIPMSELLYQQLKKKAEGRPIPEPGKKSKT